MMIFTINYHNGIPIYRQVIQQIREQVMTGELAEGEQLDSVRDLAGRLKVNPMTISKAYMLLEQDGLLERRRGVGLFVAKMKKERKQQTREELLEENLQKAAAIAVQMNISETKTVELLKRLYREFSAQPKE